MALSGILLAAGAAKRFGGGKLLHALADGTPLGVASARHLLAVLPDVLAVVRGIKRDLAGPRPRFTPASGEGAGEVFAVAFDGIVWTH